METIKSNGHICFIVSDFGTMEYYVAGGELYRAPIDNCIDTRNGYRIGRWECSVEHFKLYYESVYKSWGIPEIR